MSATFDRLRNCSSTLYAVDDQCHRKALALREPSRKGSRSHQQTRKSNRYDNVAVDAEPENNEEEIPSTFEVEVGCTSPADRVECLKYQNLSDSLKKDIIHLINYDNYAEKMVAEQQPEGTPTSPSPSPSPSPLTPPTQKILKKFENDPLDSAFSHSSEAAHNVTQKDIENLREFVRMDRGLPLMRQTKQKSIDVFREPLIRPKMNRASTIRAKYVRRPDVSLKDKVEAASATVKLNEEQMLARLKRLAERYKKAEDPMYKFNWGFEMRYQSNKGNPTMPSSFRHSYETYNKPLFHVPKKLELPKRYLWPPAGQHEISYLGFRMDGDLIPLQYQEKPEKAKRKKSDKRPALRKTKRVLRRKPSPKGKKTPWNYGMFQKD